MKQLCASIKNLSVQFNGRPSLKNIYLDAPSPGITVLVGRSGSGKSTLLRSLNRLNEVFEGYSGSGCVQLDLGSGLEQIYPNCGAPVAHSLAWLRRRAGMVFQTPDVLPASILANLMMPLMLVAGFDKKEAKARACAAIKSTGLWNEVKDRLEVPAARLSGGQQQRLCLARALALEPAILLLDEPTASLDAASSAAIENMLLGMRPDRPLIMVSHNTRQACHLATRLVIMADGMVNAIFDDALPTPNELTAMLMEHSSESGNDCLN